jgi:hypothetical protein
MPARQASHSRQTSRRTTTIMYPMSSPRRRAGRVGPAFRLGIPPEHTTRGELLRRWRSRADPAPPPPVRRYRTAPTRRPAAAAAERGWCGRMGSRVRILPPSPERIARKCGRIAVGGEVNLGLSRGPSASAFRAASLALPARQRSGPRSGGPLPASESDNSIRGGFNKRTRRVPQRFRFSGVALTQMRRRPRPALVRQSRLKAARRWLEPLRVAVRRGPDNLFRDSRRVNQPCASLESVSVCL